MLFGALPRTDAGAFRGQLYFLLRVWYDAADKLHPSRSRLRQLPTPLGADDALEGFQCQLHVPCDKEMVIMVSSNLMLHAGGRLVELDELEQFRTPPPDGRWFP